MALERHVAVFAFPFATHPSLLLSLIRRLASAAPTVVFSFFSTAKSNRALFHGPICPNIRPFDVSDGIPEDCVFTGKPHEDVNLFLGTAEKEFRRGVKAAEADIGVRISCLVVDAFLSFSSEIAEEINVPWVSFWAAGACSLSAHFHTDLIRQKVGLDGTARPEDEIADLIPGFSTVRLGDLPNGVLFGDLESPFSAMLFKMGKTLTKAAAVPVNSFQELDPHLTKNLTSNLKNFLNIGPVNPISKSGELSCISWLDGQKHQSVAYVSFGTVTKPPPDELVALAGALEDTKTPFLWSIKDDSIKHLPKGFVERTRVNGMGEFVSWAPQIRVLEHVAIAVFVTHGGWNSVLESIGAGVPLICRPFFGDHHINTWMVEKVWGIGVRIEGGVFTKDGTRCALERVLWSLESSTTVRGRCAWLKELAHKAVGPDGSSDQNFKILLDVITSSTL